MCPKRWSRRWTCAAGWVPLFTAAGVRIIRLGLHSSPEVKEKMVAGAFHDSFGELVYSRMLLRRVLAYPPARTP